jgi:PAT family beta-lactamase induction signal transducer AmpG
MNGFSPNRRFLALLLLGLSSGLPLTLSGDLLSAWLTDTGFDPAKIGLLGLAGLPYAFKFLWSPLADRFVPPWLGRRRGWMAATQLSLIAAILLLSMTDPARSLLAVGAAATLVAFLSATQDIVIDAWRVDILDPEQRGPGAAISVTGYRFGMIASSAGALILVGRFHISWPVACRLVAAGMTIGLIGVWLAEEPLVESVPRTLRDAVVTPLLELLHRNNGRGDRGSTGGSGGSGRWLILLFVLIFKLPEHLANAMSLPFLLKIGFAKEQIGAVRQGLGVAVTIVGALLGGLLVRRWGIWKSLWIFGVLHSVSNIAFLTLAETGPRSGALVGVITVENLCIGLTTAGFTAWMIGQCDTRFSAFQFALLSGIMALGRVLASPLGGWMAQQLGWPGYFTVSALFGLPGLLLLAAMQGRLKDAPGFPPPPVRRGRVGVGASP